MAETVSSEKVKNLLSSFLLKPDNRNQENKSLSAQNGCGSKKDTSNHLGEKTTASPSKSSGASTLRSYESFQKRVDTFSNLTWFGKPSEVSPLVCARYGWENVDTDMLQCVGCKNFLCGKLPPKNDIKSYTESLTKLQANILASHDRFCVLAAYPCPESFCLVPVDDPLTLSTGFCDRAQCLEKIQDRLPRLDKAYLESMGYNEGQAGAYCKKHLTPNNNLSLRAVTLAFAGWTHSPAHKDVLICSMCRRQIGLWNFAPGSPHSPTTPLDLSMPTALLEDDDDVSNGENGEPSSKKRRISTNIKQEMNPVDEHHHWCPWLKLLPSSHSTASTSSSSKSSTQQPVSSTTSPASLSLSSFSSPAKEGRSEPGQQKSTQIPAFIAALKVIAPGLMDNNMGLANTMKKSPMIEGLRCIRRVLKTWSSPKARSEAVSPS